MLGASWNFLFIDAITMLTGTCRPAERFKTRAVNDFILSSTIVAASLSDGAIQTETEKKKGP